MSYNRFICDGTVPTNIVVGQGEELLSYFPSELFLSQTVINEIFCQDTPLEVRSGIRRMLDRGLISQVESLEPIELFVAIGIHKNSGYTLGLGECEVIAIAKCRGWGAILDDGLARDAAYVEGVRYITGTLGLLYGAYKSGHIDVCAATAFIRNLHIYGRRIPRQIQNIWDLLGAVEQDPQRAEWLVSVWVS